MRSNVSRVLRDQLGEDPTRALVAFVAAAGEEWKQDVLNIAVERFERRLSEECATLRVEMAEMGAAMRVEMAEQGAVVRREVGDQIAALRADMAAGHVAILRWSFVFWIGQLAAIAGLVAFMLGTR